LGVWATGRSRRARAAIKAWKPSAPFDPAALAGFAAAMSDLIRAGSPILPPRAILTGTRARVEGDERPEGIEPRSDFLDASVDHTNGTSLVSSLYQA
jgi:hypothetical protein